LEIRTFDVNVWPAEERSDDDQDDSADTQCTCDPDCAAHGRPKDLM
jgi:hypothetical protein